MKATELIVTELGIGFYLGKLRTVNPLYVARTVRIRRQFNIGTGLLFALTLHPFARLKQHWLELFEQNVKKI